MSQPDTHTLLDRACRALDEAVAGVVESHRRDGRRMAVWRNGTVTWIPAEETGGAREEPGTYGVESCPSTDQEDA